MYNLNMHLCSSEVPLFQCDRFSKTSPHAGLSEGPPETRQKYQWRLINFLKRLACSRGCTCSASLVLNKKTTKKLQNTSALAQRQPCVASGSHKHLSVLSDPIHHYPLTVKQRCTQKRSVFSCNGVLPCKQLKGKCLKIQIAANLN